MAAKDFKPVFKELKSMLTGYAKKMDVAVDKDDGYGLNVKEEYAKGQNFFAAAQVRKNYVSYYLMPVYLYPELLEDMSPELKKRMQGKSCFNFSKVEEGTMAELDALTKKSYEKFVAEGLV
ncbi:MAG: hypothetical protein DWQ07_08340 [Chloroflexi bacterium]|nr:MAG: hypothetical protein DWQ07_08340 [Chloroflexota bacterium]MBL1193280.1 hypothetical protein [Chloroflexota bacterium]NOH10572.1 hypothetical protein [Chloroflexota bacterium]